MNFDVQAHPLLSAKAKALVNSDGDAFHAQVDVAEALLGLPDTLPTAKGTLKKLALAVVLQVNFQIEQGIDPFIVSASSSAHTRNSATYRDRSVDPRAAGIVTASLGIDGLAGKYSGRLVSFRFQGRIP